MRDIKIINNLKEGKDSFYLEFEHVKYAQRIFKSLGWDIEKVFDPYTIRPGHSIEYSKPGTEKNKINRCHGSHRVMYALGFTTKNLTNLKMIDDSFVVQSSRYMICPVCGFQSKCKFEYGESLDDTSECHQCGTHLEIGILLGKITYFTSVDHYCNEKNKKGEYDNR